MRASVPRFVRACVNASGHAPRNLLVRYLTNQPTEFHQTSADDVVQATDELNSKQVLKIKRSRSRSRSLQGQM